MNEYDHKVFFLIWKELLTVEWILNVAFGDKSVKEK